MHLYILWTPHQRGNQCIVEAGSLVLAIQEAILQIGGFANDWTGHKLDGHNKKWQAILLRDSQILTRQLS